MSPADDGWIKALAGRVAVPEAGLVLLAALIWVAVIRNLSNLEELIALTLLLIAALLTLVILWIMFKRTPLLGGSERSQAELEQAVEDHMPRRPTVEEYDEQLQRPLR